MLSNRVREIMTPVLTTAEVSASIFDVLETMAAKNVDGVIVTDHQAPVGVFTGRDVLRRVTYKKLDPKKTSIKRVMSTPIYAVRRESRIIAALGKMDKRKLRHLAVRGDRQAIVGMISLPRILEIVAESEQYATEPHTISSIMSADLVTVDACQPVREAMEAMIRKGTGYVIVLIHGEPEGIFTERDVLERVATRNIDTRSTPIREVMTPQLVTMPESALIGEVLAEMRKRRSRNMPIRGEKGELVGIASMGDILKYAEALNLDRIVDRTWKEIEEFWNSDMQYTPG